MVTTLTPTLADPIPATVGESPIWDAEGGRLIWVDVLAGTVHFADASGHRQGSVEIGLHVGTAIPGHSGEVLLATSEGFSILGADRTITSLSTVLASDPDLRFNDGKADPRGRAIVGTLSYSRRPHAATLSRLDDGPRLEPIVSPVSASNGLGWSADGRTMYYVDTPTGRIDAFDYELETGTVGARRILATIPEDQGRPDGLCVDHDGGVWVALWGGYSVLRFTAAGDLDQRVEFPMPRVTSCAFGGPAGDTLFVTTAMNPAGPDAALPNAGCLFTVDTGFSGAPATPWRRVAVTGGED